MASSRFSKTGAGWPHPSGKTAKHPIMIRDPPALLRLIHTSQTLLSPPDAQYGAAAQVSSLSSSALPDISSPRIAVGHPPTSCGPLASQQQEARHGSPSQGN